MTAIEINAEIYRVLSTIAEDETLLKKAAKALKRLAEQKNDEALLDKDAFFARVDEAKEQIKCGKCKKMLHQENLDDFLRRNGYV